MKKNTCPMLNVNQADEFAIPERSEINETDHDLDLSI
jgi:hypothetical protein